MFIQVPLSQGATLPAGLGSDLGANDTVGGVPPYHTERQGLGGGSLQSDLPGFHICGAEQIK